jgi:hypothetical protein
MEKNQYREAAQQRLRHIAVATLLPLWIDGQYERLFEEIDRHHGGPERVALAACLMKELARQDLDSSTDEVSAFMEAALGRISY